MINEEDMVFIEIPNDISACAGPPAPLPRDLDSRPKNFTDIANDQPPSRIIPLRTFDLSNKEAPSMTEEGNIPQMKDRDPEQRETSCTANITQLGGSFDFEKSLNPQPNSQVPSGKGHLNSTPSNPPDQTYQFSANLPPPMPPSLLPSSSSKKHKAAKSLAVPTIAPPPAYPPGLPPPGGLPGFDPFAVHASSHNYAANHGALIPTVYRDDITPDDGLIRTTFNKKVFISHHKAGIFDFEKHSVLLRIADPDVWYRWPSTSDEEHIMSLCKAGQLENAVEYLSTEIEGRPISPLNASIPHVWASPALTTPIDDDLMKCLPNHRSVRPRGACDKCTDTMSNMLENTCLVYIVVLSTFMDPAPEYGARGPSPTEKVVKVIKFGSRESAAAEVFYAAGVQGWDVVFAAVLRGDAMSAFGKGIKAVRVPKLYELAHEDDGEKTGEKVRVFY